MQQTRRGERRLTLYLTHQTKDNVDNVNNVDIADNDDDVVAQNHLLFFPTHSNYNLNNSKNNKKTSNTIVATTSSSSFTLSTSFTLFALSLLDKKQRLVV